MNLNQNNPDKANLMFFGNSVNVDMQITELKSFLKEIHLFIDQKNESLNSSDNFVGSDFDELELEERKYHFKYTHGDNLRKSLIISLVILLDQEVEIYCDEFKAQLNLKIGFNDLKGAFLEKFKTYTNKVLNLEFNFNNDLCHDLTTIVEIRNCFIHHAGNVENYNKRKLIEAFTSRHNSTKIENDFIYTTEETCMECLDIVEEFFYMIYDTAFKLFPGKLGPYKNKNLQPTTNKHH